MNPEYDQPQPSAQPAPQAAPPSPPSPQEVQLQQDNYKHNPLSVMQNGEQVVCEIKRHPIGLFGMYAGTALGLIVLAVCIILVPRFIPSISSTIQMALILGFLIILVFVFLFTYVSTTIYKNNRWIVTTDSITQITQVGLFRKQVSQLSLANLEDITATQNGVVQSMFKFGTLRAETAGERSKFVFPFCPNPNSYAREVLGAREAFIRNDPAMAKRANDQLNTPR